MPPVNDREEIFNSIEKNRADQVNAELKEAGSAERVEHTPTPLKTKPSGKDAGDDGAAIETDDDDLDGGAGGEGETVAAAADKGGDKETIFDFLGEDKLASTKVKVKINGVEQEVAVADLVRTHQQDGAAADRLRRATEAQTRADQVLADANAEAERIRTAAKGTQTDDGNDGGERNANGNGEPSDKTDALKTAMGLMYEGNQEEAARLIAEDTDRRVEAKVQQILAASGGATDKVALAKEIREEMSWETEIGNFSRDNQDIVRNPRLKAIFQDFLNEAGPSSPTHAIAIETARVATRSWMAEALGQSSNDAGNDSDKGLKLDDAALKQRREDKAGQRQVRSNTNIRSQSKNDEPQEYNPSAIVAEMKAARGQ